MPEFIIFSLALFVRIFNLTFFPLNHDEATWSLGSVEHFDKFIGIPVACYNGYIQPIFSYFVFFSKKIFSRPELIIRIPAVIISLATVMLIYKLAKEMYGRKAGLVSALLLCFLPWYVIQSRIGVSLILTPFFGCLIFYALFRSVKKQSKLWFLLSWVFLGVGSFYTYQASLLFVPLFLITLLWIRKDLGWLKLKTILLGIFIFLLILYPLIFLYAQGKLGQYFGKVYRMYYQDEPFKGTIVEFLMKAFINFKDNMAPSFKGIFFSKSFILYGQALDYPLLINYFSLVIIICSIFLCLYHRKVSDKIILVWLILGYLGALSGVRSSAARYIIIILPPAIICIGKFIGKILDSMPKRASVKRVLLLFIGVALLLILAVSEIQQLLTYYYTAPLNLEECRFNSYGCKQAAQILSKMSDIKDYTIRTDSSMEPLYIYLDYFSGNKKTIDRLQKRDEILKKGVYFVIWSPESHPQDYRNGEFSWLYSNFRQNYPEASSITKVIYPNGLPAIEIFRIEEEKIQIERKN